MANFLYVDNSNVWIEGMHVAAVKNGLAPDIWAAGDQRICDNSWRLDFGRLMEFAGGERHEVGRAVLYGSRPPEDDSIWLAAKRKGFEVVVYDRNVRNKEKKIDTRIATDIVADSFQRMKKGDEVTLVAGDSDYVPTVENVVARGFKFWVVFWDHASRELRESCSGFTSLNQWLELLARKP
jgi:uncharacterized LabA/DUF88 family protein